MLVKGKGWGGRGEWSRVEGGGTGGKERQMGKERERNMWCVVYVDVKGRRMTKRRRTEMKKEMLNRIELGTRQLEEERKRRDMW